MGVSICFETDGKVKTPGQFAGKGLVLSEAIFMRRADGLFVKAHRVGIATLDARNFRRHQRVAISIVFFAIVGPQLKLLQLAIKQLPIMLLLGCSGGGVERRQRERMEEVMACLDG